MTGEMIVPLVTAMKRVALNVEDDERGIGYVEVRVTEPRTITVNVRPDDDDVLVVVRVSPIGLEHPRS